MEILARILQIYMIMVVFMLIAYALRHFIFTFNRAFAMQRIAYEEILDSDLPSVSVLIPMHNEELVAGDILRLLVRSDYPREKLEIIPINDHSDDKTGEILDEYAAHYAFVKPLRTSTAERGKQIALNAAMEIAKGEVIIVFDADYLPPHGILRDLAICFKDPEVGAVMGRVVPVNAGKNLLTRLFDLERSAGYQVEQQARYNLGLTPQYGGTDGGFRRDVLRSLGGFRYNNLTEDTDLSIMLHVRGWKVLYANALECYEEAPESWSIRAQQIRRWSRGHNQVMFRHLIPLLKSPYLSPWNKIEGVMFLGVYMTPLILLGGMAASITLFFLGKILTIENTGFFLFMSAYTGFGSFAAFYQVGTAVMLDGSVERIRLIPLLTFNFMYSLWNISIGAVQGILDWITKRPVVWGKTTRFREEKPFSGWEPLEKVKER